MAKFTFKPMVADQDRQTTRFGAGTGSSNNWTALLEIGKAVKLSGDSRYDLAVAGDPIEGFVESIESATADGYTIGTVQINGRKEVVLDGLQATPGTGAIAIGDYVNVGTVVAKGTALTGACKVTKATAQPGAVAASLTEAGLMARLAIFGWRLVSASGTAVGSTGVIEKATR